jgi:anti-sigma B factor antagonist
MQLTFDERHGVTVVRVQDTRLTYPILARFLSEVREKVEGGARHLLLDLSTVGYVDSACIGCFMEVHRLLQERDGVLRLSGLQPPVETLVSMTGVDKVVPLHQDEEDALAAFSVAAGQRDERCSPVRTEEIGRRV